VTERFRDMEPEDFPLSIVAWRRHELDTDRLYTEWLWAVTVLRPPPGERVELPVPGYGGDGAPVYVTTYTGEGVQVTTGPYG
jgi:hypothetical protein